MRIGIGGEGGLEGGSPAGGPGRELGLQGHKEKGKSAWWFGYKEHLAVDTRAELTLSYKTTTASEGDSPNLRPLLKKLDGILPQGHLKAVMADTTARPAIGDLGARSAAYHRLQRPGLGAAAWLGQRRLPALRLRATDAFSRPRARLRQVRWRRGLRVR
jgi:Transposase DDE domain